jgi:hypothetical protein
MKLNADELQVVNAVKYYPSISMILSFEPAISLKTELEHRLKVAADNVKRELQSNYTEHVWKPVFARLEAAIEDLDYNSARKSIAVYVSPLLSKVFYLDIPIEEKTIIDDSFEIRDLIYADQQTSKAIVLLLTGKHAKAFLAEKKHLLPLKLRYADTAEFNNDPAQVVANFSDASAMKEMHTDKFLRGIDQSLTEILKIYNLPVFLLGAERLLGHFGRITANKASVADIIHGSYEESTDAELIRVLKPSIEKLRADNNVEVLRQLEQAQDAGKLELGVKAVWYAATRKLGKTLIVEKDFMYPADHTADEAHIQSHNTGTPTPFYIKDAVDDIIEKVIEYGGDIIFLDDMLEEYQHIALIRYY